jgi:ABC-type transport system involved in multi-copper enzyme maturation permease subunit
MAIQDFGYRGYQGVRTGALRRVLAIAWSDIAQAFKTKKFLVFFAFCLSPAIMAFVVVYIRFIVIEGQGDLGGIDFRARGGMARMFGRLDTVEFFVDFAKGGTTLLTILFSAVVGAGIVSKDRRAEALEIYFTRGIRPVHYVAGKWLGVVFLMLCQVLFPFLAVWLFGVAVASAESEYFTRTAPFIPRVIAAQAFLCGTLAFFMVALSASTDSARFALLRWAGGLFLLMAVARILLRMFQDATWLVVSPWHVTRRVAFAIAEANDWQGLAPLDAWIAWAVMVAAAIWWLRRHLQPVEVVA